MALDDHSVLGCGRTIEQVWANIEHPPTAHEAGCEHCTAARDSLHTLQQMTAQSRAAEQHADQDPDEELHPSARVRANVIAIARAEVRRARRIPVVTTEHGPILISEQTLLALIRAAIDSVPGMRARRLQLSHPSVHTNGPAAPDALVPALKQVTCRVAVAPGVAIPAATATARDRVAAALARHLRLEPESVDIVVEDLYEP